MGRNKSTKPSLTVSGNVPQITQPRVQVAVSSHNTSSTDCVTLPTFGQKWAFQDTAHLVQNHVNCFLMEFLLYENGYTGRKKKRKKERKKTKQTKQQQQQTNNNK